MVATAMLDSATCSTVTLTAAVLPLLLLAVMVAVPKPTALTIPLETVATEVLLELQVRVLLVALLGETVAVRVWEEPVPIKFRLDLFRLTPVTVMGFTVTLQLAVLPLLLLAVMVAVPKPTALTTPLETVATEVLLELQVRVLLVALLGETVAVRVWEEPVPVKLRLVLFRLTPVTATVGAGTVTLSATGPEQLPR